MAEETSLASAGLTKHAGDTSISCADQYEFLVFLNSVAVALLAACITFPGKTAAMASHYKMLFFQFLRGARHERSKWQCSHKWLQAVQELQPHRPVMKLRPTRRATTYSF
jgi:hypothetical protein